LPHRKTDLVAGVLATLLLASPTAVLADSHELPPLVTGKAWVAFDDESKIAFVLGLTQILEFERQLRGHPAPVPNHDSFIPPFIEGLKGKEIGSIVSAVDGYYAKNPGEATRPVVDTILQVMVLPHL
jgi:hypothetical protein